MTTKTNTESFWAFPAQSTRAAHYFRSESTKSACGRRTGMTYDSADVVAEGALTWTTLCQKCEAAYQADKSAVVIQAEDIVAFPNSRTVYVVMIVHADGIAETVGNGGLRRSGPVSSLRFVARPEPTEIVEHEKAVERDVAEHEIVMHGEEGDAIVRDWEAELLNDAGLDAGAEWGMRDHPESKRVALTAAMRAAEALIGSDTATPLVVRADSVTISAEHLRVLLSAAQFVSAD